MSGALWGGASTILLRLGNIAIMAVVVRIVTPEDFGVFAVAIAVYAVIVAVGSMGLPTVMARADTDQDAIGPTLKTLSLAGCALTALVLFLTAGSIASALGAPDARDPIRVMSLAVVLVGAYAVPGALLARELRQDRIFLANMIAFVPSNGLLVVLALYGDGALAFAWSRVFGQLVSGLVMTWYAAQPYRFGFSRFQARFVLAAGLPMAGTDLLSAFLLNVDYVFIANLLGTHQLGLYVLAFNVANWSTWVLGAVVAAVGVATFSRATADGVLELWVHRAHQSVAFLAWPACALSAASAGPLIETIYGHQWKDAALVLAIMAPYAVLLAHVLVFGQILNGTGHGRAFLVIQVVWLVALVPTLWLGATLDGTTGVALAHIALVLFLVLPLHLLTLRRIHGIRARPLFATVVVALPGVLAAVVADLVSSALVDPPALKLVVGLAAGCLAYIVVSAPYLVRVLPEPTGSGRFDRVHRLLAVLDRPRRVVRARLVRKGERA
ncbi:oligosaccharide flippase family protein [Nocardioides sp. P5_E3]